MTAPASGPPLAFGLIVVADEVLAGGRSDAHLPHFKALLQARGHGLAWHWLLPDDPRTLTDHLRFSLSRPEPVFCCGGIGATPDDHTRACAAAAAGLPLTRHPGAAALIEGRFGEGAYPHRILMADLPEGCDLIDNPYNRFTPTAPPRHAWTLIPYPGPCEPVRNARHGTAAGAEMPLPPEMWFAFPPGDGPYTSSPNPVTGRSQTATRPKRQEGLR